MDGTAIMEKVRAAYAHCPSYQDTGDVVCVFIHDGPPPRRRTTSRPFSTWFVRPNRFRFESARRDIGPPEEWNRHVVWERDGVARSWWSIRGEKEPMDLSRLLAGATGISGGAAHRIPHLLMPERFKPGVAPQVSLAGLETIADIACHKLELAWEWEDHQHSELWWVGVDDSLIRREYNLKHLGDKKQHELINANLRKLLAEGKIEESRFQALLRPLEDLEPFRVESTTSYKPSVGIEIADETFDFTPPA
ncbi:MAG TPA: hypothetical protein VHC70_11905 [Phycisphaerales bacterium]|nr:hypothetical protein [Phycisphaerales bacterium]